MTANELYVATAALIEEIAKPKYDRNSGSDQQITRAQWLEIRLRFETLVVMNMPRLGTESDEQ